MSEERVPPPVGPPAPASGAPLRLPVAPPAGPFPKPPAPPDDPLPDVTLEVGARERALLLPEVTGLLDRFSEPSLRAEYTALAEGLHAGAVQGPALRRLEQLLELGLESGRFRRQHGPLEAQTLYRLYGRTPRGAAVATALKGVNDALAALDGQRLDRLTITAKGPGDYELSVETDQHQLTLALGAAGVRVVSVEAGT